MKKWKKGVCLKNSSSQEQLHQTIQYLYQRLYV